MSWLKRVEIAWRKSLMRGLGLLIRRNRPLPPDIDFDACKFLFLRWDRIGDVLVSTPVFSALKERYPSATVDVLLGARNHFVLDNEPLVRKRWVFHKNLLAVVKLVRALRAERYDFVVDMFDNASAISTVFLALIGGRYNVGLAKENAYIYDVAVPSRPKRDTHVVDRLLELLRAFRMDVEATPHRIRYRISPASRSYAEDFWREHGLAERQVVGVNISAGASHRHWGQENFRNLLGDLLRELPSARILLFFHPDDRQIARDITASFGDAVLTPATPSFDTLAALVERLSLLVTPDTSVVQLAAAFQVPAVVLYARHENLHLWTPYRAPAEDLMSDTDDLGSIAPRAVLSAARRLSARSSPAAPRTIL